MEKKYGISQDDVSESKIFQANFPSKDELDLVFQDIEEHPNANRPKLTFKRASDPKDPILCLNPLSDPKDNLKSTHILSIICPDLSIKPQFSLRQSYPPTNPDCPKQNPHLPISKPLYSSRSSKQIHGVSEKIPVFKEPRQPTFTYFPGSSKSQTKIPSLKSGIKDTISPKLIENKYKTSLGLNKNSSISPPNEHLFTSPIFPITELKDENSDITYTNGPDKELENHEEFKGSADIQEEISFKSPMKNEDIRESLNGRDKKIRTLGEILHIPRNRTLPSIRPKTEHSPIDDKKCWDQIDVFARRSLYNEIPSKPYKVYDSISSSPRKSEVRNSSPSVSKDWSPSFLHARNAIEQIKTTNNLRNSRPNSTERLIRSSTPSSLSPSVPSLKPEKLIKQFEAKVRKSQEIPLKAKKDHQRSNYLSVDFQHNSIDKGPELNNNPKNSPKHRKCLSLYIPNSTELNIKPKICDKIIDQVDILCVNCYECIQSNDVDKHSKNCFKPIIGLPERFCVDERIKKLIKAISFHKNACCEISLKAYCKLEEYSEAIISQSMSSHMISEKIDEIFNESLNLADGLPVGIMARRLSNLLELKGQFTTQLQSDDLLKMYEEEAEKQKKELEKWKLRSEVLLQLAANSSNQLHDIDSDLGSDTASIVSFSTGHSELVPNSEIHFDIDIGQVLKAISAEELEKYFYSLCFKAKMSLPKSHPQQNTTISDLYKSVQQNNIPVSQWKDFISRSFNIH